MTEPKSKLQAAYAFVQDNHTALCNELHYASGMFKHNGLFRQLESMLDFAGSSQHRLAISLIQDAAVEKCTKDDFYKKRADSAHEELAKVRKELDTAYEDLRKARALLHQARMVNRDY